MGNYDRLDRSCGRSLSVQPLLISLPGVECVIAPELECLSADRLLAGNCRLPDEILRAARGVVFELLVHES